MNNILKKNLMLSGALLLAGCSNVIPNENAVAATSQTMPSISPVTKTSPTLVNWKRIEATADQLYQDNSLSFENNNDKYAVQYYASEYRVSLVEAERRLIKQQYSSELFEAIQ